jgi:hypothetical protein
MYDGNMTNPEIQPQTVPTIAQLATELHKTFSMMTEMMTNQPTSSKEWQILSQAQAALSLASGIIHEYRYPHAN